MREYEYGRIPLLAIFTIVAFTARFQAYFQIPPPLSILANSITCKSYVIQLPQYSSTWEFHIVTSTAKIRYLYHLYCQIQLLANSAPPTGVILFNKRTWSCLSMVIRLRWAESLACGFEFFPLFRLPYVVNKHVSVIFVKKIKRRRIEWSRVHSPAGSHWLPLFIRSGGKRCDFDTALSTHQK